MSKEAGKNHDQGPLSQMMQDLEKRNRDEFGSILFSTYKNGSRKTFVFPTPLSRETYNSIDVDEFLVITVDGPKAIQVVTGSVGFANAKTIGDIIRGRLGKKPGFFSAVGWRRDDHGETLSIKGELFITQDNAIRFLSSDPYDDNCRLVEIDENRVEQILQANIERVKKIQATSRVLSGVLKTS